MEKENKDKDENSYNFVERAALKRAINRLKPGAMKYKGLEKIYDPEVSAAGLLLGMLASGGLMAGGMAESVRSSNSNINNYINRGRSEEASKRNQEILKENEKLMSEPASTKNQRELVENTRKEMRIPFDNYNDLKRVVTKSSRLSEKESNKIIDGVLRRFQNDLSLFNNIEATRPDAGTLGHSLDVGIGYGRIMKARYPKMTDGELEDVIHAAMLHDYGKGMIEYRYLNSESGRNYERELFFEKHKPEIDRHERLGAEALRTVGEELASKYAGNHHEVSTNTDADLLKAMDIYNAMTGDRVYREPKKAKEALEEIQKWSVVPDSEATLPKNKDKIAQSTFDLFKSYVENGVIGEPTNAQSPLYDVYMSDAKKAAKDAGITKYTIVASEHPKAAVIAPTVLDATVAGGLAGGHDAAMSKAEHGAMIKKLLDIIYNKDLGEYLKLKGGYYKNDKEAVEKMFAEHLDEIIDGMKE